MFLQIKKKETKNDFPFYFQKVIWPGGIFLQFFCSKKAKHLKICPSLGGIVGETRFCSSPIIFYSIHLQFSLYIPKRLPPFPSIPPFIPLNYPTCLSSFPDVFLPPSIPPHLTVHSPTFSPLFPSIAFSFPYISLFISLHLPLLQCTKYPSPLPSISP